MLELLRLELLTTEPCSTGFVSASVQLGSLWSAALVIARYAAELPLLLDVIVEVASAKVVEGPVLLACRSVPATRPYHQPYQPPI